MTLSELREELKNKEYFGTLDRLDNKKINQLQAEEELFGIHKHKIKEIPYPQNLILGKTWEQLEKMQGAKIKGWREDSTNIEAL